MLTKEGIEKYFMAEKAESWIFMAIGIAGIAAAVIFFFAIKTPVYKGAAIPLLAVGLLLGVVGYTVYNRSDEDRIRNVYAFGMNPGQLKEKELPRMEVVMKNFVLYRYVEIVLALLGIGLFFYFNNNPSQSFWKGLGAGLAIMALLALTADYFAEKRGQVYLNGIKDFVENKLK
jgi:drug/metabolite transporter (DMT)-like permease